MKRPEAEGATADANAQNAAKRYKKFTQHQHVLARPGMYVGSPEISESEVWVAKFSEESALSLAYEKVTFAPALYKIFDEVLTNALDASTKDETIKKIAITVTEDEITVRNDGNGEQGIPVARFHGDDSEEWVPTMIFGVLLTSGNFTEERDAVAGTHGLGVKLASIFSTHFSVKIRSGVNGSTFEQTWSDSMHTASKPKVKICDKPAPGYVEVAFKPLPKLLENGIISDALKSLLAKRALDVALAARADMKVTFNGHKLPVNNLKAYAKLLGASNAVVDESDPNWRVAVAFSENPSVHGLVNGVSSVGKHVDYVIGNIAAKLGPKVKAKRGGKEVSVSVKNLREHSVIIVSALVKNPLWSSQVKTQLDGCDYKSRYKPADDFIEKLASGPVASAIISSETHKIAQKASKSTDGKKVVTVNIPKLRDATWAGSSKSKLCTLILTEGDSALTFAVSALQDLGFDRFGAYPLRGVPLNVRDASASDIAKNVELTAIKQIVGLKDGVDSFDGLRYHRIWLCTDQDADGAHIRALVLNFLFSNWPNLVRNGLVEVVPTPIIRARKGNSVKDFYSVREYEAFDGGAGWYASYFKGLGSWTSADARDIFKKTKPVKFVATDETEAALALAFAQKKKKDDTKSPADRRKDWIYNGIANMPDPLTYDQPVTIERFIHTDYLLFCIYDVERKIAQVTDGFWRAQVKIMHTVLDGGYVDAKHRIKVAQLGARVAERTLYLHGETSLFGGIVNMGQLFTGSNNVPLLAAEGMFGSRLANGKDRASPRYIHTHATKAATVIFRKEDVPIYKFLTEEGQTVEPDTLLPLIPMILVNGSDSISVGFSSTIPAYDPKVVLANVRHLLRKEPLEDMHPWYREFRGTIERSGDSSYKMTGVWEEKADGTVVITELPVGLSLNDYADSFASDKSSFALVDNRSTGERAHFVLRYRSDAEREEVAKRGIEKVLKLTSSISLNNMYAFDTTRKLKKYASPEEILRDFVEWRLEKYGERKVHMLSQMDKTIVVLTNKARFVKEVATRAIDASKFDEDKLVATLKERKYDLVGGTFNYLLDIPLRAITTDRARKLEQERDAAVAEREALAKKAPENMWLEELEAVEKCL